MRRILAVAVLVLSSPLAFASMNDGNTLNTWISANSRVDNRTAQNADFVDAGFLTGYVQGVYDAGLANRLFCMPAGVTTGQLIAVVAQYLKPRPNRWNEDGATLVLEAFNTAFPCKK